MLPSNLTLPSSLLLLLLFVTVAPPCSSFTLPTAPPTRPSLSLPLTLLLISPFLALSTPPPKYFYVFGARRTGARYLSELIRLNTNPHNLQDCAILSSHTTSDSLNHHQSHAVSRRPDTHHIPDLDHDKPSTFMRNEVVSKKSLLEMQCPVEDTLFIYITKDPYSWLASIAAATSSTPIPRRSLLRSVATKPWNRDATRYKNAMVARSEGIKAGKKLKHFKGVEHYEAVKYEDFLAKPQQALKDLMGLHGIHLHSSFKNVYHDTSKTGVERMVNGKKVFDHVGVPFNKFKYYTNHEYVELFDAELMSLVTKELDKDLETSNGYETPPKDFLEKHKAREEKKVGRIRRMWDSVLHFLWLIIAPVSILLGCVAPLSIWLASSEEGADTVAQGDGVTADQEEDRRNGGAKAEDNSRKPLADGWFEAVDVDSGKQYFFHRATRAVTWVRPTTPAATNQQPVSNKKDDDYDHNSMEFQDALYKVAREQATRQTNGGQNTDAVTHEIAGKLRRRFVKRAVDQQTQSENVRREVESRREAQRQQQMVAQRQADERQMMIERGRQAANQERREVDEYQEYVQRQQGVKHEVRLGGRTEGEFERERQEQMAREEYVRNMELELY